MDVSDFAITLANFDQKVTIASPARVDTLITIDDGNGLTGGTILLLGVTARTVDETDFILSA